MPSPYLYTCLSVRPTFALSRKKKNTWSQVISTQQLNHRCDFVTDIRSGRSIGLLTFKTLATGILIVIHPVWIYLRMGKKSSFGRCLREASSLFPERDGLLFYLLSFCKNKYHPFPPLPFWCQNVYVYVTISFLLSLFVHQIYRNNETNYSFFRCFVNANTLPKLIVTQSWP